MLKKQPDKRDCQFCVDLLDSADCETETMDQPCDVYKANEDRNLVADEFLHRKSESEYGFL